MDFPAVRLTVTQTRRHTDTYRSCDTDTDTCHRRATHVTLHGAASQQIICDVIPQPRATLQGAATFASSVSCHPRATHVTLHGAASQQIIYDVIPQPRVTLQGAATLRVQCHVILEPRVTLQGAATLQV